MRGTFKMVLYYSLLPWGDPGIAVKTLLFFILELQVQRTERKDSGLVNIEALRKVKPN